jgi:hypothetical protein
MRRYVWGILLLLAVLAAFLHPAVVTSNRDRRSRVVATRVSPPDFKAVARVDPVPPAPAPPVKKVRGPKIGLKSHPQVQEDPERVVYSVEVTGRYSATETEAWDDVWDQAQNRVTHELHLLHVPSRETLSDPSKVHRDYEEEKGPTVEGVGEVVRVHLRLGITAAGWHELAETERSTRAQERMNVVARGLAVLTALLGAVAGYIRVDEWTKGYYTGRLRLAVIALVALAAVAVIA